MSPLKLKLNTTKVINYKKSIHWKYLISTESSIDTVYDKDGSIDVIKFTGLLLLEEFVTCEVIGICDLYISSFVCDVECTDEVIEAIGGYGIGNFDIFDNYYNINGACNCFDGFCIISDDINGIPDCLDDFGCNDCFELEVEQ